MTKWRPWTSQPAFYKRAAAMELSTPPLRATTTDAGFSFIYSTSKSFPSKDHIMSTTSLNFNSIYYQNNFNEDYQSLTILTIKSIKYILSLSYGGEPAC
jgi:hypothetical protein